jgi:hypothetical protein
MGGGVFARLAERRAAGMAGGTDALVALRRVPAPAALPLPDRTTYVLPATTASLAIETGCSSTGMARRQGRAAPAQFE